MLQYLSDGLQLIEILKCSIYTDLIFDYSSLSLE